MFVLYRPVLDLCTVSFCDAGLAADIFCALPVEAYLVARTPTRTAAVTFNGSDSTVSAGNEARHNARPVEAFQAVFAAAPASAGVRPAFSRFAFISHAAAVQRTVAFVFSPAAIAVSAPPAAAAVLRAVPAVFTVLAAVLAANRAAAAAVGLTVPAVLAVVTDCVSATSVAVELAGMAVLAAVAVSVAAFTGAPPPGAVVGTTMAILFGLADIVAAVAGAIAAILRAGIAAFITIARSIGAVRARAAVHFTSTRRLCLLADAVTTGRPCRALPVLVTRFAVRAARRTRSAAAVVAALFAVALLEAVALTGAARLAGAGIGTDISTVVDFPAALI